MVGMGKINLKKETTKMYYFQYVTAKQLSPMKQDLITIIHSVQNLVQKDFTFQFYFVGSIKRNMVTYDVKSNVGFDFDIDIHVNDDECRFSAEEIKTKIRLALDKVAYRYGYDNAEDSTRVITIKVKDRKKILHSCDFAIVSDYVDDDGNERQEYIHFNKKQKTYSWQEQPQGFYLLEEKAEWIKDCGYWNELRTLYLYKKNCNNNPNKHSRSIYAETVHEMCQKYGYYNQ